MNPGDVFTLRIDRSVKFDGEKVGPHEVVSNRRGNLFIAHFDQMPDRPFVVCSDEYPMVGQRVKVAQGEDPLV